MSRYSEVRAVRKSALVARLNACGIIKMLLDEGMALRDARELVFVLWERGELDIQSLEQDRRRWLEQSEELSEFPEWV
jgi:hypothetical protein